MMIISHKSMSNQGTRSINEDYYGTCKIGESYCFAVADGLGGHGKGDLASKTAINAVLSTFEREVKQENELREILSRCFQAAQDEVMNLIDKNRYQLECKTTLVILLIKENKAIYGHIGDSRLYMFKKSFLGYKIENQTLDHSVPQMLVFSKEINKDQIRRHPDRNRLLRVIGVEWQNPRYEIDTDEFEINLSSWFLICTDGFWEWIKENEMVSCLKKSQGNISRWLELMDSILLNNSKNEERDNCTATVIKID